MASVNAWLATRELPGAGSVTSAALLRGGLRNQVFLPDCGGMKIVVRRPPPNANDRGNDTMRREARVLRALAGSGVPEEIVGAVLYLVSDLSSFTTGAALTAEGGHSIGAGRGAATGIE